MSGAQPPRLAPEEDATLSGLAARLRPWQIVTVGVVSVLGLALVTHLPELFHKTRATDAAALTAGVGGTGEAWHAPTYPASEPVSLVRPTPPPLAQVDAPRLGPTSSGGVPDFRLFGNQGQPLQQQGGQTQRVAAGGSPSTGGENALGGLLKPTELPGYKAARMPHPWATIEQGRIIACNTVTKINSSLPGFVSAKTVYDTYGADGSTILLERNSTVFGEVTRGLVQGMDRVFVLWRSVLTPPPNLVRITLNSPAADEIGQSGLDGTVDQHLWKRIGGAVLLSGIQAGLQGLSQGLSQALSGNNRNGGNSQTNFYQFQSSGDSLASQLLQHTISIPDVLTRDQAMPCEIFAAGDLDFSDVYSLRRTR